MIGSFVNRHRAEFPPAVGAGILALASSNPHIDAALDGDDVDLPDTALPDKALGFRVQGYGVKRYSDLFLPRQARSVAMFSDLVALVRNDILRDALQAEQAQIRYH